MTLNDFIIKFDYPGSIILLEGKRDVLLDDKVKLERLGGLLTVASTHIQFRSGNASGADEYFSLGVTAVDPTRLQVISPYSGHRSKKNLAFQTFALDTIDLANEPQVIFETMKNKKYAKLISDFIIGYKRAIKGAYLLRDTVKVIGTKQIPPSDFAIFYDDLSNPNQGGTGHTMSVCLENNVPFIDQTVWMQWL